MKKIRFHLLIIFLLLSTACSKLFDDDYTRKSEIPLELVYEHEFRFSGNSCVGLISTTTSQIVFLVDDLFHGEIVRLNSDFKIDTVIESQKTLSGLIQTTNNNFLVSVERGDYDILNVIEDFSKTEKIDLKIGQNYDPYIVKTSDGFIAIFGGYGMINYGAKGTGFLSKFDFNFNTLWETEFESLNKDVSYYKKQNDEVLIFTNTHELIKINNQNGRVKEKISFNIPKTDIIKKFIHKDDNFYLLALSNQPIDTIPDNHVDNDGCCCNDDIAVYKIDGNGKTQWSRYFGNSNANEIANDIILNEKNEIIVVGNMGENNCISSRGWDGNYSDIYVIKISNEGKVLGETIKGTNEVNEEAVQLLSFNNEIYTMCRMHEVKNNESKDWLRLYKID